MAERIARNHWAFCWWKAMEISVQLCELNNCPNVCLQTSDGWWYDGDEVASMWLDGAPCEMLP